MLNLNVLNLNAGRRRSWLHPSSYRQSAVLRHDLSRRSSNRVDPNCGAAEMIVNRRFGRVRRPVRRCELNLNVRVGPLPRHGIRREGLIRIHLVLDSFLISR